MVLIDLILFCLLSYFDDNSVVGVPLHLLAKILWLKLTRFRLIWLDLGEIWAKLRRNLSKVEAKFKQN